MDVVGCFIYEPLFYSDLILTFMYAMMILMSEYTHNRHNKEERRWGGGDNCYKLLIVSTILKFFFVLSFIVF